MFCRKITDGIIVCLCETSAMYFCIYSQSVSILIWCIHRHRQNKNLGDQNMTICTIFRHLERSPYIPFTLWWNEKSVDWSSSGWQSQAGPISRSTPSNRGSRTGLKISTSQDFNPIQSNSKGNIFRQSSFYWIFSRLVDIWPKLIMS